MRKSFVFLLGTVAVAAVHRQVHGPACGGPVRPASARSPAHRPLRQGGDRAGTASSATTPITPKGISSSKPSIRRKRTARRRRREDRPQAARRDDAAGRARASAGGGARRRSRRRSRRGWTRPPRRARIPGRRTFQRLNRAEYDARRSATCCRSTSTPASFLPPDTISAQLRQHRRRAVAVGDAARRLPARRDARSAASRSAIPTRRPNSTIYKLPRLASQLGARRRRADRHARRHLGRPQLPGRRRVHLPDDAALDPDRPALSAARVSDEQIEVSVNGERVAVLDIDPRMSESDPNGMNLQTPPIAVKAGPQRVSAAFLRTLEGAGGRQLAPVEQTLADTQIGSSSTASPTLPHLREFAIVGPYKPTGVSDTPSRRRDLHLPAARRRTKSCRAPTRIISTLGGEGVSPAAHAGRRRRPDDVLR